MELAKANDVHALIVFSGERKGMSDEEGLKNTIVGLKRVAKAAEEANREGHGDLAVRRIVGGTRT